ncbi:MAG: TetR/AcrR family transcriptional regulator [Chakrabartia sp.]
MKRAHHHGTLKEALVLSALELLDSEGVEAVTIRATARGAGVSHAAPVNHFPDRRALLTAVAIHCFEELKQKVAATGFENEPDPRNQIIAFVDAFHAYGLAKPNRYRFMWRRDMLDETNPVLTGMTDSLFDLVAKTIAKLGEPAGVSVMSRVVATCSIIHGYVLLRIDGNFQGFSDEKTGQPRHKAIIDALLS